MSYLKMTKKNHKLLAWAVLGLYANGGIQQILIKVIFIVFKLNYSYTSLTVYNTVII